MGSGRAEGPFRCGRVRRVDGAAHRVISTLSRMESYTKVFRSITMSSVWSEPPATKVVWFTLLVMADQHGEVQASIPGLAREANVSLEECETALKVLSSPDTYSRTPEREGRRIVAIDGGWWLVNHSKYRRMASVEDVREKNAERKRRQRDREKEASRNVTPRHGNVTVKGNNTEAEANSEAEGEPQHVAAPQPDVAHVVARPRQGEAKKPLPKDASEAIQRAATKGCQKVLP